MCITFRTRSDVNRYQIMYKCVNAELIVKKKTPCRTRPANAAIPTSYKLDQHASLLERNGWHITSSLAQPIAHQRIHTMIRRAEPPQLDTLAILNLLGIRVSPLDGHLRVGVRIDEDIEGAVAVELRQKRHARGDLPEDGGDLGLDLRLGLLGWRGRWGAVFLVGRCCGGFGFGFGFRGFEDLDL